jgi:hypothetical protein
MEHGRFRIEDDPALVQRDGCLLALAICFLFWAAVILWWWLR